MCVRYVNFESLLRIEGPYSRNLTVLSIFETSVATLTLTTIISEILKLFPHSLR